LSEVCHFLVARAAPVVYFRPHILRRRVIHLATATAGGKGTVMKHLGHTSLRRYRFRVYGASAESGQEVELVIEAMDEGDASRRANQQGIYVAAVAQVKDEASSPVGASRVAVMRWAFSTHSTKNRGG